MNESGKSKDALMRQDIVRLTGKRISELVQDGKIHLPENYSAQNALMAAWLTIQETVDKNNRPAIDKVDDKGNLLPGVCTKESVANALLDMIVQGLTPAKKQVAFIIYGEKLICQREVHGHIALLKRAYPGYEVYAEPFYKDDKVITEIVRGKRFIKSHEQNFENIGNLDKIIGAYATIYDDNDQQRHCEIMTIEQIKNAWAQGENWPPREGKKSAHQTFPEEFCKKTVIARACKRLINSSNDSYLVKAVERQNHMAAEAEMQARVEEDGNQEIIDLPSGGESEPIVPLMRKTESEAIEAYNREKDGDGEDEEGGPSSPTARFNDFIDEHGLNASKGRKVAAMMRKLDDARKLGNEDYEAVLTNADAFLASYRQQHGGGQVAFGGPGF